jgi:hypothetical protein
MAGFGGKREGAGRKKTLKSDIIQKLRSQITKKDYKRAVETLRYAMEKRETDLKTAVNAAQFVVEQKAGRAKQAMDLTTDGEKIGVNIVYSQVQTTPQNSNKS